MYYSPSILFYLIIMINFETSIVKILGHVKSLLSFSLIPSSQTQISRERIREEKISSQFSFTAIKSPFLLITLFSSTTKTVILMTYYSNIQLFHFENNYLFIERTTRIIKIEFIRSFYHAKIKTNNCLNCNQSIQKYKHN